MVASFKIMPPDIAFLYQSTEKCGMDGGFSEKLPVMEKCGSLIFGRLQLKLNTLFSLFHAGYRAPDCIEHTGDRILDPVYDIGDRALDRIEAVTDAGFHGIYHIHDCALDAIPYGSDHALYGGENRRGRSLDGIQAVVITVFMAFTTVSTAVFLSHSKQ